MGSKITVEDALALAMVASSGQRQSSGPAYPAKQEVTVNAAPTADTARLLKELEEKAMSNLIDAMRVESTGFEGLLTVWREAASFDSVMAVLKVSIVTQGVYGQEIVIKRSFREGTSQREIYAELVQTLATEIASRVVQPAFEAISREVRLPW